MIKALLSSLAVFVMACGAPKASVGTLEAVVPPDSAARCAKHCDSIGLRLSSVVIMASTVGCVCTAAPAAPTADASAAAAGGASAVVIAQQAIMAMQQRK